MNNSKMTRKDFLKKSLFGVIASVAAISAIPSTVGAVTVTDNLSNNNTWIGSEPPVDKSILWVDTGDGGTVKFWDGTRWKPTRTTWAE